MFCCKGPSSNFVHIPNLLFQDLEEFLSVRLATDANTRHLQVSCNCNCVPTSLESQSFSTQLEQHILLLIRHSEETIG